MDFHDKMMRTTIGLVGRRAIDNIRRDPKRGVRSLADMGAHFAQTPLQKQFFSSVQRVFNKPGSLAGELVARAVRQVDAGCLIAAAASLGYGGFTCGAARLREREGALGLQPPWLLLLCLQKPAGPWREGLPALLGQARELGIYTFFFALGPSCGSRELEWICALAGGDEEGCFIVSFPPGGAQEGALNNMPQNLVPLVRIPLPITGEARRACALLAARGRLFGFHQVVGAGMPGDLSPALLTDMAGMGCILGCYSGPVCRPAPAALYDDLCRAREAGRSPILCLDVLRDAARAAALLQTGQAMPVLDGEGRVWVEGTPTTAGNAFEQGLQAVLAALAGA